MHVGILGGGNISATHARAAVAAGCRIGAVFGQNRDKTRAIAREHGAAAYDTQDAFFAHRPMDLVAIGSPSGLHADQVAAAARQGLHVLVEKPLDISVAQADRAIACARQAGVRLGVFFQDRLKPDLVRLREIVCAGRLGNPILISARVKWYRPPDYYTNSRWRGTRTLDGGGALINQGIHTIDTLLWLIGPIVSVSARTATGLHDIEVEDTLAATLGFSSGALATFETTTAAYPGYARRIEITGTEGTANVEGDSLVAIDVRTPGADTRILSPVGSAMGQASPLVSDVAPHQRMFENFIRAIETNGEPACSGEEGRRSIEVVEALYESARRGGAAITVSR